MHIPSACPEIIVSKAGQAPKVIEFDLGHDVTALNGTGLTVTYDNIFDSQKIVLQRPGVHGLKDLNVAEVNSGQKRTYFFTRENTSVTIDNRSGLLAYCLRRLGL